MLLLDDLAESFVVHALAHQELVEEFRLRGADQLSVDVVEMQVVVGDLVVFIHRLEELWRVDVIVAQRILAGFRQQRLRRLHQTVHRLPVVFAGQAHHIDDTADTHGAQCEHDGQGDQQGDLALERMFREIEDLLAPPAEGEQQQEHAIEDHQIGERYQMREERPAGTGNHSQVFVGQPVYEMYVSVPVGHRIADRVIGRRRHGISVAAPVRHHPVVGVSGIRIMTWQGRGRPRPRRQGIERIADHVVAELRLKFHEQPGQLKGRRIGVGEDSQIRCQSVVVVQIIEVRAGCQRHAVLVDHVLVESQTVDRFHALSQRDQVVGRAGRQGDVVLLDRICVQIALQHTVLDHLSPVDRCQDGEEGIGLDSRLHIPQEQFQRQVAFDGQLARIDTVALVFLVKAV